MGRPSLSHLSTTPVLPSHSNMRRGPLCPGRPLHLVFRRDGGCFDSAFPLCQNTSWEGSCALPLVFQHEGGGISLSPTPPPCQNTRWGTCLLLCPPISHFDMTGVFFHPTCPSLMSKHKSGRFYALHL